MLVCFFMINLFCIFWVIIGIELGLRFVLVLCCMRLREVYVCDIYEEFLLFSIMWVLMMRM